MYTTRVSSIITNYFKVIDKKGFILAVFLVLGALIIINALRYTPEIINVNYLDINRYYNINGHLWPAGTYDYIIPFISSVLLSFAFYNDYKNNAYEIMTFYNRHKINTLVCFKLFLYIGITIISVVIGVTVEYRELISCSSYYFILLIRVIPPIVFVSGITVFLIITFKNTSLPLAINFIYVLADVLSDGRVFKIFTLHGNSFYLSTVNLFYINRFLICIFGIILLIISIYKSSKIN